MNRFQFVEDHKDALGVRLLCEVIEVTRSSFCVWLAAVPGRAARAAADAVLAAKIRVLQDPAHGGDCAYGAPRIAADLKERTVPSGWINHKRVARVMREHRLAGIRLRQRVRTTIPGPSGRRFPDCKQMQYDYLSVWTFNQISLYDVGIRLKQHTQTKIVKRQELFRYAVHSIHESKPK